MPAQSKLLVWLKGLVAAFICGGAGSVTVGLGAMGIDSEHFNFSNGLGYILKLVGVCFVINAIVAVSAYLKKSPVPWDGVERRAM